MFWLIQHASCVRIGLMCTICLHGVRVDVLQWRLSTIYYNRKVNHKKKWITYAQDIILSHRAQNQCFSHYPVYVLLWWLIQYTIFASNYTHKSVLHKGCLILRGHDIHVVDVIWSIDMFQRGTNRVRVSIFQYRP